MPQYSILIACDQKYYNDWAENLLKSIHYHCPKLKLRCHVVNHNKLIQLPYVKYTLETKTFKNDESRIAYLQAVRFLCASKIPAEEQFITLDADTICARPFSIDEFASIFSHQHVLKHHKADRWLAGLVAFKSDDFRNVYASRLLEEPVDDWLWGRDQDILCDLADKYNYTPIDNKWIRIAKPKPDTVFLTLKGEQKVTEKYLVPFQGFIK